MARFIMANILIILLVQVGQTQQPSAGDALEPPKEFWYKITYQNEKLGYTQQIWENVLSFKQQPAWKVTTKTVIQRVIPGLTIKAEENILYLQKDNFSLIEAMITGRGTKIIISRTDDKVLLNYKEPDNKTLEMPLPADGIYIREAIGPWLVQQTPQANKIYTLKVVSVDQYGIVNISLRARGKIKERIMDKEIEGYLIEYQYPVSEKLSINVLASLDNEGLLLKGSWGDLTITRTTPEDAQKKTRDKFERNNRYDPFIPKWTSKSGQRFIPGGPLKSIIPGSESGYSRLDVKIKVKEAQKHLNKMREVVTNNDYPPDRKEKDLTAEFAEIRLLREEVNQSDFLESRQEIEEIFRAAEKLFPIRKQIYHQAEQLHTETVKIFGKIKEDSKKALKDDSYTRLAKNLEAINNLAKRPEIGGTEEGMAVGNWAEEVKELYRRSEVIREFHTNVSLTIGGSISYTRSEIISLPPLKIKFLGLPLNEKLAFKRNVPGYAVFINGDFYEQNSFMDKAKTIFIKSISRNNNTTFITFIYKEETISIKIE